MVDASLAPIGKLSSSRPKAWSQTSVFVEQLQMDAVVGVYPHEKERPQPISIDLEILLRGDTDEDLQDDLAATLDYDWAVGQALRVISQDPVDLLETLAHRLAEALLSHPLADVVTLRIVKLGVIPRARAGVMLRVGRGHAAEQRPLR